jgi:hypothetical protein
VGTYAWLTLPGSPSGVAAILGASGAGGAGGGRAGLPAACVPGADGLAIGLHIPLNPAQAATVQALAGNGFLEAIFQATDIVRVSTLAPAGGPAGARLLRIHARGEHLQTGAFVARGSVILRSRPPTQALELRDVHVTLAGHWNAVDGDNDVPLQLPLSTQLVLATAMAQLFPGLICPL